MTTMNMPALPPEHHHDSNHVYFTADQMLAYAEAAVLAEREACAILAWSVGMDQHMKKFDAREIGSMCASTIRARKETK